MNEQLEKFKRGDIVLGKVIEIEASKALIEIDDCEPVYIIKEVASTQEIESIEEVLQLGKVYEFGIAIDYSAQYYKYNEYYLSISDLEYSRSNKRLEQLAEEDLMVYTTVIQSYDYGVLVNIENKNFLVSNIHLKTLIPNQELVGQIIPVRVVNYKTDTYNRFYASHRSALNSDRNKKEKFNSIIENNSFIEKKPREYLLYALDDVVVGKVIKIFSDYALVDIGIEKYAYIHLREMSRWAKSPTEFLHLNLIREFIISDIYYNLGRSSLLGLSIKKLDEQIGDKRINQIYEEDENIIFYSQIAKRNHSNTGFTVSLEGTGLFLRDGFIEQNFVENKCLKYGTPLQIIEYRGYLQLSNRHALFTLRLKTIKIGDLITGKVRAIKEYGLFVDIGEGSVLLHISKISQAATNEIDLNSIFKVDDEIQAIVIQMDIEKGRVAVSTKELEIEPGDMLIDPRLVYQTSKEMADRYRRLVIERLDTFE